MSNDGKSIESILNEQMKMPEVIYAIAAMNDGIKLAESVRHDDQDNKAAAMLATTLFSGEEAMKLWGLRKGQIKITVEVGKYSCLIVPAGKKALVALVLDNEIVNSDEETAPMVSLKLAAEKIAEIIK